MKKILLSAAAIASMLFAASCQKENFSASQQEGDVVTATITVQAPGQPATKAIGDGMTADNLVFAVFDETGAELPELRQGDWTKGQPEITFGGDLQTTVTVTLVRGKEYTFVCWAQNDEATCYDFTDMKNIGISYKDANGDNFVAQDEKRDAFYAAVASEKVTQNFTQTIELTRPFAQVNVGSADIVEAHNAGLEVENLYSTMTLTNVATSLNTFSGAKAGEAGNTDGKVSGVETVTFELAPAISKSEFDGTNAAADHEWLYVNTPGYENNVYGWLAMNYILVNDGAADGTGSVDGTEKSLTDVSFAIYEGEGLQLCSYDVPNVPVQRNYRSHILGSLLTAQGEITVVIEPAFEEPDYVVNVWDGYSVSEPQKDAEGNYLVTKPEELAWFQKNAPTANIYLVNDIDLAGQVWTPIEYFNGEKPFTFEGKAITKSGETYPTIYGLNIEQTSGKAAGLFGGVTFNFKNFTIDGAKCNCVSSFVGAVAGQLYGNLENVHVKNVEFVADPSRKDIRYGAIVGMHNSGNATGCSVDNAVVKAFHNVGGISGTLNESNNNRTYSNCTVKNSTFEAYCTEGAGASMVGALTGNANGVILYYEDCVAEGNNVNVFAGYGTSVDLKVPVLNVDNTEFAVACDAIEVEINIESNIAWTVAGKGVTATPAEGEGNGTVVLEFGANETYEEVVYTVTVASEAEVEPVVITITQEAAVPVLEDGEYWIIANGKYAMPLTSNYGWVYLDPYGYMDNVFTFKSVAGGYTIQDPSGQYYYQTGTYNSFNRSATLPDEGAVWEVTMNEDGSYKILNSAVNKYVQYNSEYNSFGSYADVNGIMPALVKAENPKERLEASNWGLIGVNGDWDNDITMFIKDNYFVAYDVEIKSGAFKFRQDKDWTVNFGGEGKVNTAVMTVSNGADITVPAGTYDIYLDVNAHAFWVMTAGQIPTAPDFKLVTVYASTTYTNLYAWSASGAILTDGWPGSKHEATEEIAGQSFMKWTLVVDASTYAKTAQFIFNNGSTQTKDSQAYKLADEMFFNVSGTAAPTLTERPVAEVTVEKSMSALGLANGTVVKNPVVMDENVTVTFAQGKASTAPTYYTSGTSVRLYQNGATMLVDAGERKIKSIEITFADNHYYMAPDCGEFSKEAAVRTWTGSASQVKFTTTGTDKNHRAYVSKIKVTYE